MQGLKEEALLTAKEVASYLRLSRQTVCNMAQDGKLPGINVTQAKTRPQWRFRREDVERLVSGR